jgi:hypothetical protein
MGLVAAWPRAFGARHIQVAQVVRATLAGVAALMSVTAAQAQSVHNTARHEARTEARTEARNESRSAHDAVQPSGDVMALVKWTQRSADHHNRPFVVVDKINARLFVFDADGRMAEQTPVLLGLARGDESVPGIGKKKYSEIRPEERTTAAGRFVAERGRNLTGEDIVWLDYEAALAIHRIRPNTFQQRLSRFASANPADKRISYGCVNVPVAFFENVIAPMFSRGKAIVYVMPEQQSVARFFGIPEPTQQASLGMPGLSDAAFRDVY